jgi:ribosomal protein S18 acetylase RimI-like enzyme
MTAEIDEFFVLPEYRGTGLGRELLVRAESVFRDAGCKSVSLQVGIGNDRARSFYRRQGYARRPGFELLEKPLSRDA